jgi:DNA (cytosine-5)-methyltransferase 1
MNHGSLFSGIGGFDLAAEWAGWENVFHCEWNPFGQRVLKHHFPKSISYNDITKTDFTIHKGAIDILSGGFPCQPYSMAGLRKGKEDERHLWPQMLRAIREIEPRWVVGENVSGLINWGGGVVFDEVQVDLETEGYEVLPFLLPACGVNAPHRRDRVWFVAFKDTNNDGRDGNKWKKETNIGGFGNFSARNNEQLYADNEKVIVNTNNERGNSRLREVQSENGKISEWNNYAEFSDSSNDFTSDTSSNGGGKNYGLRESRLFNEKSEANKWENFPTESPLCGGDDGISKELDGITFSKWRNESIKAYGNAIVPQVAYEIFKTIKQIEHEKRNPRP